MDHFILIFKNSDIIVMYNIYVRIMPEQLLT